MKNKNIFKLIGTIIIVIYVLFGTNFLDDIKNDFKLVSKNINDFNYNEQTEVNGKLLVYFIDVGQADSILIKSDNKNMLIDAGNEEDGEKLVSYLESLGVEQLDYVVATHPHEDHIGGMDDIIRSFNIKEFYMPDVLTTTKTFENLLDALEVKGLKYDTPIIGSYLDFDEGKINFIHVGDDQNNLNDTSIVLKLEFGNNSFLFTGDATIKTEEKIINSDIEIKADVLKLGHHGSLYSTSNLFLEKVNPKYAVIEVGKDNSYKHPSLEVINKLKDKNIKTYRTDEVGTIIISSDGNNLDVKTEKTDTNG